MTETTLLCGGGGSNVYREDSDVSGLSDEQEEEESKSTVHPAVWVVLIALCVLLATALAVLLSLLNFTDSPTIVPTSLTPPLEEQTFTPLQSSTTSQAQPEVLTKTSTLTTSTPTSTQMQTSPATTTQTQTSPATTTQTQTSAASTTQTQTSPATTTQTQTSPATTTQTQTSTTTPMQTQTSPALTSTSTSTTHAPTTSEVTQLVAFNLQVTLDEKFTAELLDASGIVFREKTAQLCTNVSQLFTSSSMEYVGCLVTAIESGSVKISFSIILKVLINLYAQSTSTPESNMTEHETAVLDIVSAGLTTYIDSLSVEDVVLTGSYTDRVDEIADQLVSSDTKACNNSRCSTNSQCVGSGDSYICACDGGYYGVYCDVEIPLCEELMCSSHGECKQTVDNQMIYCSCFDGYHGDFCQMDEANITYPCSNLTIPCSNHGECINLSEQTYLCICEDGYNGTDCEDNISACLHTPCIHGDCVEEPGGYRCDCGTAYYGDLCQYATENCTSSPCPVHSTCVELVNNYTCPCDLGYTGDDCHSVCDYEPCFNNATCSLCDGGVCNATGLPFRCNCTGDGIYGALCTDRDGDWSSWSVWTQTAQQSLRMFRSIETDVPALNCSYVNVTRSRTCTEPYRSGDGKYCEGGLWRVWGTMIYGRFRHISSQYHSVVIMLSKSKGQSIAAPDKSVFCNLFERLVLSNGRGKLVMRSKS